MGAGFGASFPPLGVNVLKRYLHQEPEDLFETISQTLLNAVDRDAYSGWGAVVHIM
jgi:20S proteasome alpha/beta subunit